MLVKIILLILFFGCMIAVGLYARKSANSMTDFVLGGRNVGPWLSAFAYGTSYFSAVVFVGYAGQFGWKYGLASTWIGLGNAVIGSLLAWVAMGRRTRVMTHHLEVATMPDFFGKRYDSNVLRVVASAIAFVFMIPYTASVYNGLSRLFGMAFDIPYTVCVITMAVLTGVYVILGGYMATAINDFIQGIIMLFGIVAVIGAVLSGQGGFIEAVRKLSELPSDVPVTLGQQGAFASFFGTDPLNLLGVIILTSLGTWGLPQMVHKFYAIKSEKAIKTGTIVSTFFAVIVSGGCYFLGGFGRLFSDKIDIAANGYDSVVPTMLSGLPTILIAVVVILVLSASMSTLSSLVLASSSTLTLDFIKGNIIKEMDEKKQVKWMRGLLVVFIVISVVLALIQYRSNVTFIAQLMGVSWGALAGAFLAPFLYGLYWKRTTKAACWVSFLFSTIVMLANIFFRPNFPALLQSPINAGAFCMLAGLVIVPVVSVLTKAPEEKKLAQIFACYDKKVTVSVKDSIGD